MSLSDTDQQTAAVASLHSAPRFGHSRSIASLASNDDSKQEDYIDGVVAFSIFLLVLFLVWALVLLILKFQLGPDRVGCAAGQAGPVDVAVLRQQNMRRSERKRRIIRAWRLQTTFLICSILLPALSFVMINQGITPFLASLGEIVEINDQVDSTAYRGLQIADAITEAYDKLVNQTSSFARNNNLDTYCPNLGIANNPSPQQREEVWTTLSNVSSVIESGVQDAADFVQTYVVSIQSGLEQVTEATQAVDDGINSFYKSYWALKLLLILLNVANGFLLVGVVLSKSSIVYPPLQAMFTYVILPWFGLALIGSVAATCIFVSIAILNADFCSGGSGGPQGTLQEMVSEYGYPESSVSYQAMTYYTQDCIGDNPLGFVSDFERQIKESIQAADLLYNSLNSYHNNATDLSAECGADIQPINATLHGVGETLKSLHGSIRATLSLTDCSSIVTILRRLSQGSTCTTSVEGLTWIFSCLLAISILGLVMFSTRAALYNAVISMRRKKRREKEFEDYKKYMSQFYDTSDWKMDPEKKIGTLEKTETFETDGTTPMSSQEGSQFWPEFDDGDKENDHDDFPSAMDDTIPLGVFVVSDAVNDKDESSYDSDSSSDDEDDDGQDTMNLSAMVSRFFTFSKQDCTGGEKGPQDQVSELDSSLPSIVPSPSTLSASPSASRGSSTLATPRRRRRFLLGGLNESTIFGPNDNSTLEEQEIKPLSPPLPSRSAPKAPQKSFKSLRRTKGATKLV